MDAPGLGRMRRSALDASAVGSPASGDGDDDHRCVTARATQRWSRPRIGVLDQHTQHELHEGEALPGPAVKESVLADPTEAVGQDVREHAPQELGDGQGAQSRFAGLRVAVTERDGAGNVIIVEQVAFAANGPVQPFDTMLKSDEARVSVSATWRRRR